MSIELESLISPLGQSSLSLEETRQKLKDYLISNNIIKDVNYLGSNISQIVDILSYISVQINSNLALQSNEVYLPLATLRKNVLTKAQELNYKISRLKSARMQVTISATLSGSTTISIPAYTTFNCGDYVFFNESSILLTSSQSSVSVDLKEGQFLTYLTDPELRFNVTESIDSVTIPYTNIEDDGVVFRNRSATSSTFSTPWEKKQFLVDLRDDENFFVEEYDIDNGWVIVRTHFAGIGRILSSGTIDIGVCISSGSLANGIADCELGEEITDSLGNTAELNITVLSASRGGVDEESNESIKRNAPTFYNAGDRLVNTLDYNSVLEKNSLVESANSWGGEDMIPEDLGAIYITVLPQNPNQRYLTDLERASLINYMKNLRIIATNRKFRLPHFYFVDIDIKLYGDIKDIVSKKEEINSEISDMFSDELYKFDVQFYESKLFRRIENLFLEDDNNGVDMVIKPRLLLTEQMFSELNASDLLEIYIPNSLKRYLLVKDGQQIEIPANQNDYFTYLLDGWKKELVEEEYIDITFSGSVNSKPVTTGSIETVGDLEIKRVYLDGVECGHYDDTNSILYLNSVVSDELTLNPGQDEFISVNYSTGFNVKLIRNAFLKLGEITYV